MQILKKATAASVLVGPVLDADGAVVTTSVIGDFYHTKNGTSAALASTATATHDHNGMYVLALNTTNTGTAGRLDISYAGGTTPGVMAAKSFEVLEAATFDAIVTNAAGTAGGLPLSLASAKVTAVLAATDVTGNLPSNTVQVAGTTIYSYDGTFAAVTGSTDDGTKTVTLSTLDASGATIPDNAHAYSVIQVVAGTGADQVIRLGARLGAREYAVDAGSMPTNPDTSTSKWIFLGTWNSTVKNNAIKKNVALPTFEFLMTDSTNHAPATGKTVTCTRSIDGGAFGAGTLANTAELSNGIYKVDFASGDLNGGVITLRATASGCDDTFVTLVTTP